MFCPKCGFKNQDDTFFCQNCGNKLSAVQPQQNINPNYQQGYNQPFIADAFTTVKMLAKSPLFLTAVIAFSVYLLFSIIKVISAGSLFTGIIRILEFVMDNVPEISYQIGEMYDIFYEIANMASAPIIILGLLGLVPSILICTGLWITYSSAANKYSNTMSTAGLTIIKVINILQLIGTCILCAFVEIFMIVLTIALAAESYAPGAVVVLMIIAILLTGFFFGLSIMYSVKVIKSLNAAKDAIISGASTKRASVFVAVWTFISAFFTLFTILSNPLAVLANITAMVCFGILIFNFNTNMLRCAGNIAHQTYQHQVQQPLI